MRWLGMLLLTACGGPSLEDGPCGRPLNTDGGDGLLDAGYAVRTLEDGQRFTVYTSTAAARDPASAGVLVAIHGFTGTYVDCQGKAVVWRTLTDWRGLADELGLVVVAPQFDETRFDWFQALNLPRVADYGPRADERLHDVLSETAAQLPGLDVETFAITGFSAGGQFSHRYAWLHPERVEALAAGGSGSWAYADRSVGWPYGIGGLMRPARVDALCASSSMFFVGEEDDGSDDFFSDCDANWTDVCGQQGVTRTERAIGFHASLLARADEVGVPCEPRFDVFPGVGHETPDPVDREVRDFLEAALRER